MASRKLISAIFICMLVLIGLPSIWLIVYAQTNTGIGISILGLMMILLPISLRLWLGEPPRHTPWAWASLLIGIGFTVTAIWIVSNSPSGEPAANSPVSQHFTSKLAYHRYTIPNIIPEVEQINVGFLVTPYLFPVFTRERLRIAQPVIMEIYREMESDPDFQKLGSAMGWTYADLLGQAFDVGHYYLYIPRNRPPGPIPAILFLHGSLGNFKTYTWVWSKIAEEIGCAVIAPSYGMGNWRRPGGVESAQRALEEASRIANIDADQVYLAGLSNGGLGISLLADGWPERFRGLIFISPVMATDVLDRPSFQDAWRDRPVLVIAGAEDRNIPLGYVNEQVLKLEEAGVDVTLIPYAGEDHFLFFTQRRDVSARIIDWIAITR